MSDTTDHIDPPSDDLLAAEYVLGVQGADERQTLTRRIARDSVFASLVAAWEARLTPWANDIAPVTPPHDVWNRIVSMLPAQRDTASWWNNLSLWRLFAFGSGGLAVASLVALFIVVSRPVQAPLIAAIDGGGHHHFVATLDAGRGSIAVVPAAYTADATRVPELWLIPADGKPRSLGLLRADRPVTLAIPATLAGLATPQAVLAVSLEPSGGSPTGLPTGPVIAQGKLANL